MRLALPTLCLLNPKLMLAVTLTAPMIAAVTPPILTIALAVATYFVWPHRGATNS
jgi:hypothetical protein